MSDSSQCPPRVLYGSPVRHSTTNPKQLATAAHSATISYNHYAHPKLVLPLQHGTPTRRETYNKARAIWPRLHHICGFSALRHTRLRRNRPISNAFFSSLTSDTWRYPSVRQRDPVPPQCVLVSGASHKRDANGAIETISKLLQEGSTTQPLPRLHAS